MNRQDKLDVLAKRKSSIAELSKLSESPIEQLERLSEKLDNLSGMLGDGIDVKSDEFVSSLKSATDSSTGLREAIRDMQFPDMPKTVGIEGIDLILDRISKISFEVPKPESVKKELGELAKQFSLLTKAVAPQKQDQSPENYVPYRRVVKRGNSLVFDDNTATGGGGGGNTPVVQNGGTISVPVTNPDGSLVGGGMFTSAYDSVVINYTDSTKSVISTITSKLNGATQQTITFTPDTTSDTYERA